MTRPRLVVIPPAGAITPLLEPFLDALADSFEVIPIDRAHEGVDLPSTRELARRAAASFEGRAHVFGISLGGMIAQWLAIDHPERVDHLVLASTAGRALGALEDPIHGAALARCLVLPKEEASVCLVEGVLSEPLEEADRDAVRDDPVQRTFLLRETAAAARHDATAHLAAIRAPTVVLSGGDDRLVALDAQADLAAAIGARHVVLDGVGHDLTIEAPEATARAVREAVGVDG